jgi:hypothetical protein
MRKISSAMFLALNLSMAAQAAQPVDAVQVAPVIPYAAGAQAAAPAVNNDCHWTAQVVQALIKESKGRVQVTEQDLSVFQGRKLVLLADSSAEGGAASETAPKWLAVTGKLLDKGTLIGDFKLRQEITKGSLQDCKILKEMSGDLGDGMAQWLEDPMRGVSVAPAMLALNKDSMDDEELKNCPWNTFIPKYLEQNTRGQVSISARDSNTVSERKLLLTVVESRIAGGGVYSGGKWIDLTGKLTENGTDIGSFEASRHTVKGWTGCSAAKSLSEEIGEDIAKWLKKPGMNVKLGDAK